MNSQNSLFLPCLTAFKSTLNSSTLNNLINKSLRLDQNKLFISNRVYLLNKNVHLIAIGKAAPVMVETTEKILSHHFVDGIASVPYGSKIPLNLKTQFLFGAENNLPDLSSLKNTKLIESYIKRIKQSNQIILFLISGGGSALLTAPIDDITLEDKLNIIKLLQNYGADIKQLNNIRQTLSRLKGGGLSQLAFPSKQISLIVSDIIGDPIELIASGPTIITKKEKEDPLNIINKLGIKKEQIGEKLIKIFEDKFKENEEKNKLKENEVDILNVIVANNEMIIKELSSHINSAGYIPINITNKLEGNATKLGQSMARLVIKIAKQAKQNKELEAINIFNFIEDEFKLNLKINLENINFIKNDKIVLIFGGESTVFFDSNQVLPGAKGGRNQEMVLSMFNELLNEKDLQEILNGFDFAFTSLGTDGQDGPTDAAGAYICSDDLINILKIKEEKKISLLNKIKIGLNGKCSYQFWNEFNQNKNIIKIGKTGMNVMDIQMIVFKL